MHPWRRVERRTVTYSPRTFPVGPDDTLFRLASANFSRMVDNPEHHRLERYAGQRVRMVEAIVKVHVRRPHPVVLLVSERFGFDARGRLDRRAFKRQNVALVELLVENDRVGATDVAGVSRRVKKTSEMLSVHPWTYSVSRRLESPTVSATWYGHDYLGSFRRAHREQPVSANSCRCPLTGG